MDAQESESLTLLPEFYVDFDGVARSGSITIKGDRIIALNEGDVSLGKKIHLKNQAILPGFVNCHSHVFQRMLRGIVEPSSGGDNFWTWREKMYLCVKNMTKDVFLKIAELTYLEMQEAGFTHVGEFHYVHHDINNKPFSDPLTMSKVLFEVANKVRINVRLLECAYHQGGFFEPLAKEQARFALESALEFLAFLKDANQTLNSEFVSVGAAIHSVRAVPETWFAPINNFAKEHGMPLHIHVSEQVQENEACLKAKGCSPVSLLFKNHLLAHHTTLVHATHLIDNDLDSSL